MHALLAALALVATPPAVPAFEILEKDGKTPIGSAFLALAAEDLPHAPKGTLLLVTAAHVLAPRGTTGRDTLWIKSGPCAVDAASAYKAAIGGGARILVWPGMDLAAIPFPQGDQFTPAPSEALLARLAERAARLEAPPGMDQRWTFETPPMLRVIGFHFGSVCGENPSYLVATPTWAEEAENLMRRIERSPDGGRDPERSRLEFSGSMSNATPLIQYWSMAGPGASGGPVLFFSPELRATPDGHPRVVGVHVGGTSLQTSGWAVAIPTSPLPEPATTFFESPPAAWPDCRDGAPDPEGKVWPCYREPRYRHSLDNASIPLRAIASRSRPWILTLGLSAGTDYGTSFGTWRSASSDPLVWWNGAANGTFRASLAFDYAMPSPRRAFGARAVVGYRRSRYSQTNLSPGGDVLEVAPREELALVLEAWPVEYSFRDASRVWPTVGLGGRLVWRNASNVAWAVPVHVRISLPSLHPSVAFTVDTMASLESDPDLSSRYSLVGGTLQREPRKYGVSFGVALGVDFSLHWESDAP